MKKCMRLLAAYCHSVLRALRCVLQRLQAVVGTCMLATRCLLDAVMT